MLKLMTNRALMFSICFLLLPITGLFFAGNSFSAKSHLLTAAGNDERSLFNTLLSINNAPLHTFVDDYSYWDDLVRFLRQRDQQWTSANIAPCIAKYDLDFITIYNIDSSLAYAANSDNADGLKDFQPAPASALPTLFAKNKICHFFVSTPRGIMEVMGATIHPTADSERVTPPSGYLFAGRLWDNDFIAGLTRTWGNRIDLLSSGRISTEERLENIGGIITFSQTLSDWSGRPVAQVLTSNTAPAVFSRINRFSNLQFILASLLLILVFIMVSSSFAQGRSPVASDSTYVPKDEHHEQESLSQEPHVPELSTEDTLPVPRDSEDIMLKFLSSRSRIIKRAASQGLSERTMLIERNELENRIRRRITELGGTRQGPATTLLALTEDIHAENNPPPQFTGTERRKNTRTEQYPCIDHKPGSSDSAAGTTGNQNDDTGQTTHNEDAKGGHTDGHTGDMPDNSRIKLFSPCNVFRS